MGTQINHAHTRIRIYIKNDRDESGCVPGQRVIMRYQKRGLVQTKEHKHSSHVTKSSTKSSKARMTLHSKFIFILKKFYLMLGPHQSPFILHEPNL